MKTPVPQRRPATVAAGEVRIIGGLWKRSKLPVPVKPGLRPTPDRVRETLFNWLGQNLTGLRCWDAFAGSGALGFEAASRGAQTVQLCELDARLAAQLRAHAERLKAENITVRSGDALVAMRQATPAQWDVVFLDPPFADGHNTALFEQALRLARPMLAAEGHIYLEAPEPWGAERLAPLGLECVRQGKAGSVHYHLLQASPCPSGDNPQP